MTTENGYEGQKMTETSAKKFEQAGELRVKAAKLDDTSFVTLGMLAFSGLMVTMVSSVMAFGSAVVDEPRWIQIFALVMGALAGMVLAMSAGVALVLVQAIKMRKEAGKLHEEAKALEAGELEMQLKKAAAARAAARAVQEAEVRDAEQREREEHQLAAQAASDAREAQARAAQNSGYRKTEGRNKSGGSSGRAKEL